MRSMAFLTIALATATIIGCDRRDGASNSSGGDTAVGTAGRTDGNKVSRSDRNFVQDMALANMAEIELAKLVPERSTDNEVKKFAQLMMDDHSKSANSLSTLASQHNVPVRTELDGKHSRLRDKIAKWHGNEFDRAYMDAMVDAHEDALDTLARRVDEQTVADYKAEMDDRLAGRKTAERAVVVRILPEKSDNPVTMSLNEWAAATYPVVRAHLDAARALKLAVDARPRTSN